ncbi:MAG: T9SS type A sorting domain-containing protein, partial [Bacteroidota bacterium]
ETSVTLGALTSNQDINLLNNLKVIPNPNNGYFIVELLDESVLEQQLPMQILNAVGSVVFEKTLQKYNNTFTAPVSLVDYPKGVYFIKINNGEKGILKKVICH